MLTRHDIESEEISAKTIESYKAHWKKYGFPDLDYSFTSRKTQGSDHQDRNYDPPPEAWLWVGVILTIVDDYRKTSDYWDWPCIRCHDNQSCGHVQDGRIHRKGRWSDWKTCPHYHNYHECAVMRLHSSEIDDMCDLVGIDPNYFRKKIGLNE